MLKIRKVLLVLMLLSLTPSMLKPLNAKAQLATHSPFSSELEKRLADAARQYLIGEFDLTEVGYSLVVKEVALASASARVDLQLSFRTLELGEIVEIIHVFALHDGFEPVQIFREPSPEFYLYADRVSSDLLPQERLQLWQELREAENQNQFNKEDSFLNVSLYKLPWTGGQRYYVYQDGYKHFDFSLPQGTQVRAARGGQVYVKRASIDGGCCDASCDVYNNYVRILHSDGTYAFYLHLKFGSITVNTGDTVSQGDCLAKSGNTGWSCGAHLHFNVANNSSNPLSSYLAISFVEGSFTPAPPPDNHYLTPYSQNSTTICGGDECAGIQCVFVEDPVLNKPYGGGMCDSAWYRWTNNRNHYAYLTVNTNVPTQSTNWATWTPQLPQAGTWRVEAYVPYHAPINWQCPTMYLDSDTSDARYTIYHASGSTAKVGNQLPLNNTWLDLGTYQFNSGTSGYVKLVDLNGEANLSRTVSFSAMRFTLLAASPAAPTNLSTTAASTTQINLTWADASSNESGFKIERSANGTSGWAQIGTVGANVTTYNSTGLTCGTPYYYRVRAYNATGNSAYSNIANATTSACPPTIPAAPTNLSATAASTTQINLTWADASNNESGFKIERSANGTSGWTEIATVSANVTIYINTALTCGTPYYYRVRSYNAAGNSSYSNTANATTSACPPTIPAAPTSLSATAASATQINLTWTDTSSNESGFKIERSANGASGWVEIATVGANVTTYNNTELTCGTPYYYRVRSYNTAGNSAYSNLANATTSACPPTVPAAPTNLNAAAVSTTQINLTWTDASNNESGFKIERSANGTSGWVEIGTTLANVVSYMNSGLTSGTPYYYRVRAYNAAGDSTYSNIANATTWSDNGASVYFSPMPATVAPNTQFTLTLNIANAANLGAHEQTFTFDPAVFTVTRVLPANFLSSTGRTLVFMPPLIDNSTGEVSLGAYSQSSATPPLPGPNGGGALAYVVGRASASGVADLHFTQNRITDISGTILPASAQDGSVTIIACLGDFDGNGEVGINDIQTIANLWRVHQGDVRYETRFDINGNGEIDISDIQTVANRWKKPCAATTQHGNTKAATQMAAMLWLDPPLATAPTGQTFTMRLSISDVVNLGAFETTLNYDPAALEFVSATVGEFLGSTGRTVTFLPPQVDPVVGRVDLGAYTLAPPDAGADGSGVLVNVTLRALEPGSSNLTLTSAQITTPAGTTQDLTTQISVVQIYTANKVYLPLVVRDSSQ